jgi:adenylate cyclase
VERSAEIRGVVERWFDSMTDADVDSVLGRLSEHPDALSIGTDPDEWWHLPEAVAIWRQQFEEATFRYQVEEVEAWEEGTVGWAGAKVAIALPDRTVSARVTCVLHLERGEWKIVLSQLALPQPNEVAYGVAFTATLDELNRAIQRERPDLSETTAADGTVTIVFTDIVDSTLLNARVGDHTWLEILRRHFSLIDGSTAANGGTVVKTLGDGAMLAFSSARRAVACAQDIQQVLEREFLDASPPVRIRIGIHSGDVLHEHEDFFGSTVNYAARVAASAVGGEILVSGVVRDLIGQSGSGIDFIDGRDVELAGFDGMHRLFAVSRR